MSACFSVCSSVLPSLPLVRPSVCLPVCLYWNILYCSLHFLLLFFNTFSDMEFMSLYFPTPQCPGFTIVSYICNVYDLLKRLGSHILSSLPVPPEDSRVYSHSVTGDSSLQIDTGKPISQCFPKEAQHRTPAFTLMWKKRLLVSEFSMPTLIYLQLELSIFSTTQPTLCSPFPPLYFSHSALIPSHIAWAPTLREVVWTPVSAPHLELVEWHQWWTGSYPSLCLRPSLCLSVSLSLPHHICIYFPSTDSDPLNRHSITFLSGHFGK